MLMVYFGISTTTSSLPMRAWQDMLDKAWGPEPTSRLSCQALMGKEDVVVEIPKYTINMVKEGGH